MIRYYIASQTKYADQWAALPGEYPQHEFVMTWPAEVRRDPDESDYARMIELWERNLEEIAICDALILYAEPSDILRGALIEAGAALGRKKFVICVGQHDYFLASWTAHPRVTKTRLLRSVLEPS